MSSGAILLGWSVDINVNSGFEENDVRRELGYLATYGCYDGVRDEDWYRALIAKYEPYAKDHK